MEIAERRALVVQKSTVASLKSIDLPFSSRRNESRCLDDHSRAVGRLGSPHLASCALIHQWVTRSQEQPRTAGALLLNTRD
jgi:hypothetical protein